MSPQPGRKVLRPRFAGERGFRLLTDDASHHDTHPENTPLKPSPQAHARGGSMGNSNHKTRPHSSAGIRAFCHANGVREATDGGVAGMRWRAAPLLGGVLENSVLRSVGSPLYIYGLF